MSYIYLASPYNHEDAAVRQLRYEQVSEYCAQLMQLREIVYCPIAHSHPIAEVWGLPKDEAYWRQANFAMLRPAEGLWVYKIAGWERSKGVAAEVEFAHSIGMPVLWRNALPQHAPVPTLPK